MTRRIDALVHDLLHTHPGDPANARYLVPLEDPEQESEAYSMADAIYSCMSPFSAMTSRRNKLIAYGSNA